MMETVDRAGQEEFIWAMRTRALISYEEDSQSWRESKMDEVAMPESRKYNMYEQEVKTLASFVPDEIICSPNNYNARNLEGAVLFVEIEGFDDLCEIYNKLPKGGTSRLTQVLNSYIGTFVQSIMSFNGDILKFNGRAVLSFWKAGNTSQEFSFPECIHQALDCGLSLLKSHGKYETDVGVFLRTKSVVSAGHVVFASIGTEKFANFVMVGIPIWEAKNGVEHINKYELSISASAYDFINGNEYLFDYLDNEPYVKIYGITRHWRSTQRNSNKEVVEDLNTASENSKESSSESVKSNEMQHNIYELRPSIGDAVRLDFYMKPDLRKYIIAPVLRVLDMNEGVDNLTEIRNIVVVMFHAEIGRTDTLNYINIVDRCYTCITRISSALDGCLNNIAYNDKDIHFVVIFGLRGFKHELDSQRGLFCGKRCFKDILQIPYIKNLTVAITGGLSFCGVIGHNLRREYSVIGLPINRAYKILGIYNNKICCDRQTFFHSKLEASNFILLDSKSLKGISYVGPIYEYVEINSFLTEKKLIYNPFPILDRDKEMRMYYEVLYKLKNLVKPDNMNKRKSLKKTTCIIFKGKPRQGKSRLLEEIMFCTPTEFPTFRIKLISSDKAVPYYAVQLLFGVPLGITEKSSLADREVKIMSKLKKLQIHDLLCAFNDIFRVNFPQTLLFMQFNEKERKQILIKLIKQLCLGCFPKLWVILIDGGENIDAESWPLINAMAETYTVVIIICMMSNFELSPEIAKMQKHPRYKTMTIHPIDKWYHVGLACQMMNVHGIPAELEMIIHCKSNGNPGWVESYLISLLQHNEIQIIKIPLSELPEWPLSLPPKEMMTRDFDVTARTRKSTDPTSTVYLDQKWNIFKDSFRDSTTKMEDEVVILTSYNQLYAEEVQEKIIKYSIAPPKETIVDDNYVDSASASSATDSAVSRSASKQQQFIDICQITPGVTLSEIDPEYSIDVRIMKIFDSLTSYEQLILKCSAVIGEYFSREMLLYVMNSAESRRTGLAIQNLFEIGVLGCSGGEFSEEYQNAILNCPKVNPRDDRIVVCRCIGLTTPTIYKDFPKYAFCGYLRFKIPSFRDITYDVLTIDQKKDFHSKAMRYLEKKTKKCQSCGGGSLVKLMGVRYDQDLFTKKRKKNKLIDISANRASVNVLENWGQDQTRIHKSIYYLERNIVDPKTNNHSVANNYEYLANISLKRLKNRDSLVRTFSEMDYNSCECYRILDSMYTQLIQHCEGAEQMNKWLYAVLEYSSLCIDNFNRPLALKILNNALGVIELNTTTLVQEQLWKVPFIRATIFTLIAKTRFESGQIYEALKITLKSLKTYGYNFPYKSEVKMKIIELFQRFKINYFVFRNAGNKEDYDAEYCDNVAECLILVTKIYMHLGSWCNAELAAIFSLEKALQAERNFPVLVNAYTNVIVTAIHSKKVNITIPLEVKVLLFIKFYKGMIEPNDLLAVYYLYSVLFQSRVLRGYLADSIEIGRVVQRLYNALPYKIIYFDILPLYIQMLMLNSKYMDAAINIIDLGYATHHAEYIGLIWYYALCVSFHLDTGFVILPVKLCETFLHTSNIYYKLPENSAEKRFYTAMWLWMLRMEKFEEALIWQKRVTDCWKSKKREDTLVNLFSLLYYLEGLIGNTISLLDTKNMTAINDVYGEIEQLILILKNASRTSTVIQPRLYHLRAWFALIKGDNATAMSFLKKGRKVAENCGNLYERKWIAHSELAWNRNLSKLDLKFWRDHAEEDTIDYRVLEDNDCNLAFYTFESPLYE